MIPFPYRVLGAALALAAVFGAGALWYKGVADRVALGLRVAQASVVSEQQKRNIDALSNQMKVNQALGAENAKLQADNTVADTRLRGLLRALAPNGSRTVPGAPTGATGAQVAGEEPGCTDKIGSLIERTADLAEAARADSTELTLLQRWASESGLATSPSPSR